MTLSVIDKQFWSKRFEAAEKRGNLNYAVTDMPEDERRRIIDIHRPILLGAIERHGNGVGPPKILDVGCGLGDVLEVVRDALPICYTGVDLSEEFVSESKRRFPERTFLVADVLKGIPFPDGSFDLAVLRSVEGPLSNVLDREQMDSVYSEVLRVAREAICLNLTEPECVHVLTPGRTAFERGGAYLEYRRGPAGTCEIHDLYVPEETRRQGVATRLLNMLSSMLHSTCFAFSRRSNSTAHAFYEARGFTGTTLERFYEDEGAVLFVKPCE